MIQDSRRLECFLAKCSAALLVKLLHIFDLIKLRSDVTNIQGESCGPKHGTCVDGVGTHRGKGQRRRKTPAWRRKTTGAAERPAHGPDWTGARGGPDRRRSVRSSGQRESAHACANLRSPYGEGVPPSKAKGDWLSGRAPRSHRGGHWFDPSIAHQVRSHLSAHQDHDRGLSGGLRFRVDSGR
jgi:hypothetical protein